MTDFPFPDPLPRKIETIKEIREVTGFSLGQAKALADYLFRDGGSIHTMAKTMQANPTKEYQASRIDVFWTRTAIGTYAAAYPSDPSSSAAPETGAIEERVRRIERWIQAQ